MKGAEEIRRTVLSSDTEEGTKILESLDESSIILARHDSFRRQTKN